MTDVHSQKTDVKINEPLLLNFTDSLELGNNKKALQEADRFLKKSPEITCARALKALALLRIGREDDAENLIDQIADEKPYDGPTLQVMTIFYTGQEQCKLLTFPCPVIFIIFVLLFTIKIVEKICKIYKNASERSPGNEDLLSHLFMSYVKVNDYQSQQTVALQLYKLKPKNPYYFWAIMSIVLKVSKYRRMQRIK